MPLLVTASSSLPQGRRSINSPQELLLYLVDQLRPWDVEYSTVFLAGLIRIISLPNIIICGIMVLHFISPCKGTTFFSYTQEVVALKQRFSLEDTPSVLLFRVQGQDYASLFDGLVVFSLKSFSTMSMHRVIITALMTLITNVVNTFIILIVLKVLKVIFEIGCKGTAADC